MTLLQKIDRVLEQFNGGKDNWYSKNMKIRINHPQYGHDDEKIYYASDSNYNLFNIEHLIGHCILENNPNMFNE